MEVNISELSNEELISLEIGIKSILFCREGGFKISSKEESGKFYDEMEGRIPKESIRRCRKISELNLKDKSDKELGLLLEKVIKRTVENGLRLKLSK